MVFVNIGTDDPAHHWKKYIPVKLTVHPETFIASHKEHYDPNDPDVYREHGLVECSFGKSRRVSVEAHRYKNGTISLFGFIGVYETSRRLWRVAVWWHSVAKKEIEHWEGDEYRPNGSRQPLVYNPSLWKTLTSPDGRANDEIEKIARIKM